MSIVSSAWIALLYLFSPFFVAPYYIFLTSVQLIQNLIIKVLFSYTDDWDYYLKAIVLKANASFPRNLVVPDMGQKGQDLVSRGIIGGK